MKKTYRFLYKNKIGFLICWMLFLFVGPQETLAFNEMEILESKLDTYITQHKEGTAGLATIVIKENEQPIQRMTGYANIERGLKVDEETVFEWGSASKLLIWISVMQLVEDGLIDLDEDIKTYVPDDFSFPTSFDEQITMLHLMNHQAGFDDSYTDLMIQPSAEPPTLRQALEQANVKQVFRPGEIVAYSNYSSALAAYIVEEVSGIDYSLYVNNHIFSRLQMDHTSIDPLQNDNHWVKEQRKKIVGYTTDKKIIEPNVYMIPLYPAGSVIGTANDFAKLVNALLSENGSPLFKEKKTIDFMFEPTAYYPGTIIPRIAHGFFSIPSESEVYGHGGNTLAFSTSIYLDRKNKIGVLVMTNQAVEKNFCLGIPELIFGKIAFLYNNEMLKDASRWEGMYQPARLPYHGFTKINGLLNRSSAKQKDTYHLMMNDQYYTQQQPGIFVTKDYFSMYSLDVYSAHPTFGKILSSLYSDLIQIPIHTHILQLCLVIAGAIAHIFSFIYIFVQFLRGIRILKRRQTSQHQWMTIQHILNFLVIINVGWMVYKAFSMTSYQSLKFYFAFNIFYMVISLCLCGYGIWKRKKFYFNKGKNLMFWLTITFTAILWINLMYWEFYH